MMEEFGSVRQAIINGDVDFVKGNWNRVLITGASKLLALAIKHNQKPIFDVFVENLKLGHAVFREKFEYRTPLMNAAIVGNLDMVKTIIESLKKNSNLWPSKTLNVTSSDDEHGTAIYFAAKCGSLEVFKYLHVQEQAPLDIKDKCISAEAAIYNFQESIIHYLATHKGLYLVKYMNLIEFLIENDKVEIIRDIFQSIGNNPSAKTTLINNDSLMLKAISQNSYEIVDIIARNGGTENIHAPAAIEKGNYKIVERIGFTCDFKTPDIRPLSDIVKVRGKIPLCIAVEQVAKAEIGSEEYQERMKILSLILRRSVTKINSTGEMPEGNKYTPLYAAVELNLIEVTKLLIEYGADINILCTSSDVQGSLSPLQLAMQINNPDILGLFPNNEAQIPVAPEIVVAPVVETTVITQEIIPEILPLAPVAVSIPVVVPSINEVKKQYDDELKRYCDLLKKKTMTHPYY
jgi:ankyrin repeat protein